MTRGVASWLLGLLGLSLLLAGCGGTPDDDARDPSTTTAPSAEPSEEPAAEQEAHDDHGGDGAEPASTPLRQGERFARLAMPAPYSPSAPTGKGTDDYRCFLLDPELAEDAFITGFDVQPGTPDTVHHVIMFRVPPFLVAQAEAADRATPGEGWTCFGDSGIPGASGSVDDVPWLGAWAPGGGERVLADDLGTPVEAGSQVVMQVHYNLLAGTGPDVTAARLRLASGDKDLAPLETMLLPAPVELPCRPAHSDGKLCEREAAVDDVIARFGPSGNTANGLHLFCGSQPVGPEQHCDTTIRRPATLRAVAGHMHLLGRSISIDVNQGTPREKRVLDVPVWNFDDQGAVSVDPLRLRRGDTVRVTCTHDQSLRDQLPSFEGQEERYVVWGEGTTDEMCLGMLLVTRP
jgi:Copper type II ascorbate-dependent monooxygenase, N-terminal domain